MGDPPLRQQHRRRRTPSRHRSAARMPRRSGQGVMAAHFLSAMIVSFGEMCRVRTAYRCRAYPTPEQAAVLNRTFGWVRVVWNRTLAARHRRWHDAD
ncbi:helix-turn-helix domain-containing protein [Micromonospora qiuiae]|uniref:helix-turn-helix domain-containing protein n=1 Tax=Micromonospora qiuiae TaxID=502268 RepID=UPI00355643F7